MPKILFVVQDKGGVGKTLLVRALAEAVQGVPIFEVEVGERLYELEGRTRHFKARVDQSEIDASGGRAARGEFYGLIDAVAASESPVIVDVGANTSRNLLQVIARDADAFAAAGVELGFVIVVTSDPSAIANARAHASAVKPFAKACFLVHNRLPRDARPIEAKQIGSGLRASHLAEADLREEAAKLLDAGGLAGVCELDPAKLRREFGFSVGGEVHADLTRLRYEAMLAVKPAALWLIGEGNA